MEVITVLSGQNSSLSLVFNDRYQNYLAKINSSNGRTTLAQITSIYIAGCKASSALFSCRELWMLRSHMGALVDTTTTDTYVRNVANRILED